VAVVAVIGVVAAVVPRSGDAAPPPGWTIVTSASVAGSVNDLLLGSACADALQCWGVGATISANGGFEPMAESWTGSSWTLATVPQLSGGDGGGLFAATCLDASDCWAVGTVLADGGGHPAGALIENWDGSGWQVVPAAAGAPGAILEGISCVGASACWAVGFSTDATGNALGEVTETWDGSAWSLVPGADTGQPYSQLDAVSCMTTADCWAVGAAGPIQQNPKFLPIFPAAAGDQGLVEHWDGVAWSVVPSAAAASPDGGYLGAVTCVSASDCWATGSTTDAAGTSDRTLIENWNGAAWSAVASADPAGQPADYLNGVTCLGPDQCWAVGSSGSKGGGGGTQFTPQTFIESWNGSAWSIDPSPATASSLLGSVTCVRSVACWTVGAVATDSSQNGYLPLVEQLLLPAASTQGLVLAASDGGIFSLGTAGFHGSMGGQPLVAPVVGVATTPDGAGYWEVARDGGVFAFGDASFHGSMGGQPLVAPVVGIAPTPDGGGYWEVSADGGVFAFGDAQFHGSMGSQPLVAPVVGIAATPDGGGYWEVAADGGVFAFGDASFFGSTGALHLNRPIEGMAASPDGKGYWLVASDGGVFAFGRAGYQGSVPGQGLASEVPLVAIVPTRDGQGYWLTGADGSLYAYGTATYPGSVSGLRLVAPVVAGAAT
jgi:hypothetical protein